MQLILSVTVPIYLLIGVGWLLVRSGLFQKTEMRVLGRLVVMLCLPALVFTALSQRSLAEVLHPSYLLAYAVGSVTAQGSMLLWQLKVRGRPLDEAALRGLGVSCSNSGFAGFPMVQQLLGPVAGVAMALNMVVENLLIIPTALALADSASQSGGSFWRRLLDSLKGLLRNPLIWAILSGGACALIGWKPPEPVARTIELLSRASAPLALLMIGGTLAGLPLRPGLLGEVAQVMFGKLILMPAAVFGMLCLLPPLDPPLRTAAVLFAAMPMLSVYPVLSQKYHQEDFSAAALLATTLASFFTISALIWAMGEQGGWLP